MAVKTTYHLVKVETNVQLKYSIDYQPFEPMTLEEPGCPESIIVDSVEIIITGDDVDSMIMTACDLKLNYTDEQLAELCEEDNVLFCERMNEPSE